MPETKTLKVREDLHRRLKLKSVGCGETMEDYVNRVLAFGLANMDRKPAPKPEANAN